MPGRERVHLDAALSNFALRYSQAGIWIADQAMPVKNVTKESDKYFTYYLKDIISIPKRTQRADGAEANEYPWDVTSTTYQAEEYALKDIVTDRARKNADPPLELDQDTTANLTELLLLDREYRAATLMFDTGTTFSSYTSALSGGDCWDDYENSAPYTKVEDAKSSVLKNSLKVPNLMVMGYEVFIKLRHHPDVLDRVKYTGGTGNPAVLNEAELAKAFDIERVLVGRAVYNNANEGQTVTPAYLWGKYVGVYYVNPNPPRKGVTCSMTVRSQKFQVKKWREDARGGDMIEVSIVDDEIIPCAGAGYVYSTVVS